jgi:curved DNA-binding protein CbpA
MADFYAILGLARTASSAEIRKAYAVLARERHPDRFTDPKEKQKAEAFFKEATAAFNTLSNERSRQEYDAALDRPAPTTPDEIARDAYARALQCVEAGDAGGALDLLRVAVHNRPGEPTYHATLARVLARVPQGARDAIHSMEQAIELDAGNALYHAELAQLFHVQGLSIRARRAIETALRLAPHDAKVRRIADAVGHA